MNPPVIVLVAPQLGENIGAAARVMANFGLSELRITAPRDGWPNEKAIAMAAGALDGPVAISVFPDAAAALGDIERVYATTARVRELSLPVMDARQAALDLMQRPEEERAAIMFGPEASGLNNADVARANAVITLPVKASFSSLNLAQAVAVTSYEWAMAQGGGVSAPVQNIQTLARRGDVEAMADHLEAELDEAHYFWPEAKAASMKLNMRAMLSRLAWTEQDVRSMRGWIKALTRRAGSNEE